MKVAIIGGGAAGMVTAYLLDKNGHDVTVFEKQEVLGGHIRTLNKNVEHPGLDSDMVLEGGVIEFSNEFKQFKSLLDELKVPTRPLDIGTGLFLRNGRMHLSQILIKKNFKGFSYTKEMLRYWTFQMAALPLANRLKDKTPEMVREYSMPEVLRRSNAQTEWIHNLMMYSYSIPYHDLRDFPAELALTNIKNYMLAGWYGIVGGVYTYIERILENFNGNIHIGVQIDQVHRLEQGVDIVSAEGERNRFDRVVFATPPDQILQLLAAPSPEEQRWFAAWKKNIAETIIHFDADLYQPFGIECPSEFDFFQKVDGWGYNAILNQVCGIEHSQKYFLAYNLEDRIDPSKVIKKIQHSTPGYTVDTMKYRDEVKKHNGRNRTYFTGAWLYDGLHEGAVRSAFRVAEDLNGHKS